MIHPLTLITFAAFLGSGLYVFQTKEEVAKLDRELREIRRETEAERGRTQTLSAEWARLNDQDRLRQMATSHLRHMQPMEPTQFQRLEDAQRRMPQAVAFAPQPSGFRPRADAPSAPGDVLIFTASRERPEPQRMAAAAPPVPPIVTPAPAAPSPVVTQSAAASPPVASPPVASPPVASPPVASLMTAAAPRAPQTPRPAPLPRPEVAALPPIAGPASAPRPSGQFAQGNIPTPVSAPPTALRTALHMQPAQSGSMLGGGAGSLPPPVPFNR